jgi:hypothetical protein
MIWMPLFIAISILSLVVLFALYTPIMLLLGQRPANPWTKNAFFVPYKLPQVFGFKLYPIYLAAPSIIGFTNYYMWKYGGNAAWHAILSFEGVMLLVVIISCIAVWLSDSKSESRFLVSSWLNAKKQGICPLVTFSDDATTDLSTEKSQ